MVYKHFTLLYTDGVVSLQKVGGAGSARTLVSRGHFPPRSPRVDLGRCRHVESSVGGEWATAGARGAAGQPLDPLATDAGGGGATLRL